MDAAERAHLRAQSRQLERDGYADFPVPQASFRAFLDALDHRDALLAAAEYALDVLRPHEDIVDSEGGPLPNWAMRVRTELKDAIDGGKR